jgi:hypothetical protein
MKNGTVLNRKDVLVLARPNADEAKKSVKKEGVALFPHLVKIGVMLLNVLFGNYVFYFILGLANRMFSPRFIKNIFMLYPEKAEYSRAYVYDWYARTMQWSPRLVGIFKQNGKWGLYFGISATGRDIESDNGDNLKKVEMRLERIKNILGADQKTFAGIIPSVLFSKKVVEEEPLERNITAIAVNRGIQKVMKAKEMPFDTSLIVIGGEGFIGSLLIKKVREAGFSGRVFSVDVKNGNNFAKVSAEIYGKPAILLNASRRGALESYLPFLWPGIVILNEVYPEPSAEEIQKAEMKGVEIYHISGIKAWAWPKYPYAYKGGIPCCSSHLPQREEDYEVLIAKLSLKKIGEKARVTFDLI